MSVDPSTIPELVALTPLQQRFAVYRHAGLSSTEALAKAGSRCRNRQHLAHVACIMSARADVKAALAALAANPKEADRGQSQL
jgi:hypothetical protein